MAATEPRADDPDDAPEDAQQEAIFDQVRQEPRLISEALGLRGRPSLPFPYHRGRPRRNRARSASAAIEGAIRLTIDELWSQMPSHDPCSALLLAITDQALHDAYLIRQTGRQQRYWHDDALRWIGGEHFEAVCTDMGLDHAYVKRRFTRIDQLAARLHKRRSR